MSTEPFKDCPRFECCSANVCPLDPRADERDYLPREDVCAARLSTRQRIAARYPDLLPLGGMTPAEARAAQRKAERRARAAVRWEAMPAETKAKFAANAARIRERSQDARRRTADPVSSRAKKPDPAGTARDPSQGEHDAFDRAREQVLVPGEPAEPAHAEARPDARGGAA